MTSDPPGPGSSSTRTLEGRHGQYELLAPHGQGGSSITYRARRVADGLPVVVKVLQLQGMGGWNAYDLFEREAAVLRALSHPGIPTWVDQFPLGSAEAPAGFALVQTFIEGPTLAEMMRTPGALSPDDMLRWFDQLLEVLEYLHGRSPPVIHRDVTPRNVILRRDGGVALVDFGSVQAAALREGRQAMTSVGTFGYAAPEQFLGRATPASDLHGAAMTFLAVSSGLEPNQMELTGARVDVTTVVKGDARLARLLAAMTESDPRRRLADAGSARAKLALLRSAPAARPPVAAAAARARAVRLERAPQPAAVIVSLRTRLLRHEFTIEPGGQLGHTPLEFRASRPARRWERLPAIHLCVATAEDLEGYPGHGAISAPPIVLLARRARARHPGLGGVLDRMWGPPATLVTLVVSHHGLAPHAAARVEAGLPVGPPVAVAAVIVPEDEGVTLMTPAAAWGSAHAAVRAHLVTVLTGTPRLPSPRSETTLEDLEDLIND